MKEIKTPQDFHEAWEYRHIFESEATTSEEPNTDSHTKRYYPKLKHYHFRGYELHNTKTGRDLRYSLIDPNGHVLEENEHYGSCITKLWQIFDGA